MKRTTAATTMKDLTPLAVFLFLLWFVVSGKSDTLHLAIGVFIAYLFSWLSYALLQRRLDPRLNAMMALRLPVFGAVFLYEVLRANLDVFRRVFARRSALNPRIVAFDTFLTSDVARTTLANCITLTPGTVTVEVRDKRFYVHCLAAVHAEDLLRGRLERLVAWLFAEGPEDARRLT